MGRKQKKNLPIIENLTILDAGAEGKSIGKSVDGRVVFVPYTVPGDVVNVQITKKRNSYMEGKVTEFCSFGEKRIEPVCEHFTVCGGCKWQNMKYTDQLFYKQKQATDNLKRIGKIEIAETLPILPSESVFFYRNKLEYTFSNRRWLTDFSKDIDFNDRDMNGLGFHIPGMFDRVLDINKCHLQDEPSNHIRLEIRKFALENGMSFFDLRNQEGFLRNLIIRNTSTGEWMVIVVFYFAHPEWQEFLLSHIRDTFKIDSLMYVINDKHNDTISDLDVHLFDGKDHIMEEMEGLKFKIGPKSFYQTNSIQAYNLYKIARDFADFQGDELVYDLYTGTGTIANFVAKRVKKVLGIEYVESSIADARVNSQINNISNTVFFAGDMMKVLNPEFIAENGKPDVVITDPPRAGMHPKVVEVLLEMESPKIVYISCNPATQARDLQQLSIKYDVLKSQAVDMFPQTHHVENVVLLKLKNQ